MELAEDGTLFLDEIGDMTLETQIKLLRLLEEGTFERVGGSQTLKAQTHIVAATNHDLEEMVSAGDFREDLYYRLNAFPLYLPPLRERKEDIPLLAEFFKNRMAAHLGKDIAPLTPEIIEVLQTRDWPGNVAGTGACDKPGRNRVFSFPNRSGRSQTLWFLRRHGS